MAETVLCSIPDCGNHVLAKGLCQMHYWRNRRHGSPLRTKSTPKGAAQDYLLNVVLPYEGNECLIWPYSRVKGYGQVAKDRKMVLVTRLACEEKRGPPPTPEHEAAHNCGNGHLGCVTKSHLRWATHAENAADMIEHGTLAIGGRHGRAKLTETQVKEIMSLKDKETRSNIAFRFGVSKQTISRIHCGKNWRSIGGGSETLAKSSKVG